MTPEADKSSPPSGSGAEVTTETTPMSNSRGRKRVRFDEAPPAVRERSPEQQEDTEVETISLDIDEVCGIKKRRGADAVRTRLPGEDEEDLDETCFQRADQGAIKDFNPVVAAKRRAALREEQKRRNAMMDVSIVPADIAEAEEEYDDDEDEEQYITGDIPIEPFNLKHERETGYFDAFGNYIEYRLDANARDAWLDSLSDAKMSRKPQATSSSLVSEVEQELDKEDIAMYKRRMMALLEPGENAFAALRRLGARPTPPPPKQKHQPQETLGGTAARQRQRKQQKAQQQQQQQEGQLQEPSPTDVQGQPAAASSAPPSSLIATSSAAAAAGGTSKSASRSADQAAGASAPPAIASSSSPAAAEGSSSGAALAERDAVRNRSGEGRSSSGSSSSAGRGQHGVRGEGIGGGRGLGGMRGPAMENSAEFDKLTEYADLLLGYGELGIYTKTKEQLTKELSGSGSSEQQQQQQQQQRQVQQRQDTEEGGDGSRLVEALLSAATPAEQQIEGAGPGGGATTSAVPEGVSPPEEDDRDMFGESFEVKDSKAHPPSTVAAAAPGTGAASTTCNADPDARSARSQSTSEGPPASCAETAQPQAASDQELLQQLDGLEGQQQQQSAEGGASPAVGVEEAARQQQQHWMVNGGFELDPGSGMFYSSKLGLWYNTQTALYMDAQTGAWYRVNDTGSYEAAPEAGQGFGYQEEGLQV